MTKAVTAMLDDVRRWPNFDSILPELKLAIIQAGLHEKSRRETSELRRLLAKSAAAADNAARRALFVAFVALVIAAATLVVALVN